MVVEDELELAEVLEAYLRRAGFTTERASDGARALELYRAASPDLVLLDVMLPRMDGFEVLKRLREAGRTPVIMLTARSEDEHKLSGLEAGADDYITKPFNPREVVARVKAVLRRAANTAEPQQPLRVGPLEVNPVRAQASVRGEALDLTPAEFKLLSCFAETPERVFSRAELLEHALSESDALERVVDAHLKNLRRKLKAAGGEGLIETVFGMGYRLVASQNV